ncbi:hypothetical protein B0I37DRAFT_134673 [Chaetomium sp. MPI-CAGE-AT-0009]|nr:hypothetical protein B0I37DRAFT_134673 [Chaetomium sp. MPI-CAGE-AT-0009]
MDFTATTSSLVAGTDATSTLSVAQYSDAVFLDASSQASIHPQAVDHAKKAHTNLIAFLALVQKLDVGIVPLVWDRNSIPLGRGGTALVSQVTVRKSSGFAFKRFNVGLPGSPAEDRQRQEQHVWHNLMSEIAVLGHPDMRDHPNITSLEAVCWEVDVTAKGKPSIWPVLVFKRAEHGSLNEFVAVTKPDASLVLSILKTVVGTVGYMHGQDVIHGDLKPSNILVFENETGDGTIIKLNDFGCPTSGADTDIVLPKSPGWHAPEVEKPGMCFNASQAKKADVFSLGLIGLWLAESLLLQVQPKPTYTSWVEKVNALRRIDSFTGHCGHVLSQAQGLRSDEAQRLSQFFELSLAFAPDNRAGAGELLKILEGQSSISAQTDAATRTELGLQGFLQPCPHIDMEWITLALADGDYRVRQHIVSCFEGQTRSQCSKCAEEATVNLAVCRTLGWGCPRQANTSANTSEQVSTVIEGIRRLKPPVDPGVPRYSVAMSKFLHQRLMKPNELGEVYHFTPDSRSLVKELTAEFERLKASLGPENLIVVAITAKLMLLLKRRGEEAEANSLRQELANLGSHLQSSGSVAERHYSQLYGMFHIAQQHEVAGNYPKSIELLLGMIEKQTSAVGKDHADVLSYTGYLAMLYGKAGRSKEAETLFLDVLARRRRVFGPNHINLVPTLVAYSAHLSDAGREEDGLRLLLEAKNILDASRASDTEDQSLSVKLHLALLYSKMGKLNEAEALSRDLNTLYESLTDPEDCPPIYLISQLILAAVHYDNQKPDEAKALIQESSQKALELYGPGAPLELSELVFQARVAQFKAELDQLGDDEAPDSSMAERCREETEHCANTLGETHRITARMRFILGLLLLETDEVEEAERVLLQALGTAKSATSLDSGWVIDGLDTLGHVYLQQGRPGESADCFLEAFQLSRATYGPGENTSCLQERYTNTLNRMVDKTCRKLIESRNQDRSICQDYRDICRRWTYLRGGGNSVESVVDVVAVALKLWTASGITVVLPLNAAESDAGRKPSLGTPDRGKIVQRFQWLDLEEPGRQKEGGTRQRGLEWLNVEGWTLESDEAVLPYLQMVLPLLAKVLALGP